MSWSVERAAVRVNQLGYLPTGAERAVWVSDRREPAEFCVCDRGGSAVFGGRTRPPRRHRPLDRLATPSAWQLDLRGLAVGLLAGPW